MTLKNPLSVNPDLYPIWIIKAGKRSLNKQSKSSIVEDPEAIKKSHWLDEKKDGRRFNRPEGRTFGCRGGSDGDGAVATSSGAKFPWNSMRSFGT